VGHRSDLDPDRRGQASIFVTVDHASTGCVGIHAARRATRFKALEPLRQVRATCGAFAEGIAKMVSGLGAPAGRTRFSPADSRCLS